MVQYLKHVLKCKVVVVYILRLYQGYGKLLTVNTVSYSLV